MASLTHTLKGNASTKTVLFISIAVILAKWIAKAITNTTYVDTMFARISSIQGLALTALTNGAFVVISVTLLLVLSQEKYSDLGFHRRRLLRQIGLGALFGVSIFVLDTLLISPVASALVPKTASQGIDMSVFFGKLSYIPIWLAIALLKGGFTEELWRIFGLTRFEKLFGRTGLVLALIASSLAFGLGHAYQGLGAVLANAVQGLLYAGVYLRKRSAWEPVVAHAVFDLIGITLGFAIYA
jgi:membrane protease YdiL (CAAX protease family)